MDLRQFELPDSPVLSRADLRTAGMTSRAITQAVRSGLLLRLRRDHYVRQTSPHGSDAAVRIGGRLTCLSAIATTGAFVFDDGRLHVEVPRRMTRLRSPVAGNGAWRAGDRGRTRLHWRTTVTQNQPHTVDLHDALTTFIRCQPPRHVVATLDSILHRGILGGIELDAVFDALPRRYHALRRLVDSRAESGSESLFRLLLRQAGITYEPQVEIDDVGRVDFLLAGFLIVECDSRAHHSDWASQRKDRRRDLEAARRGYPTVRFLAEDILYSPDEVLAVLRDIRTHLLP